MITYLHVYATNPRSSVGVLKLGQTSYPCLLGKNGRTRRKREGDGKSPIGKWRLEQLFFRADKMVRPSCHFRARPLKQFDGWCDEKGHGQYNRLVRLPFKANHEVMMRQDQAYDMVVSTNHNRIPRMQNGGSAIFLHIINPGAQFTAGCIAVSERHLKIILQRSGAETYLVIK